MQYAGDQRVGPRVYETCIKYTKHSGPGYSLGKVFVRMERCHAPLRLMDSVRELASHTPRLFYNMLVKLSEEFAHADLHGGQIVFDEVCQTPLIIDYGIAFETPPLEYAICDEEDKQLFRLGYMCKHFTDNVIAAMQDNDQRSNWRVYFEGVTDRLQDYFHHEYSDKFSSKEQVFVWENVFEFDVMNPE